VVAKHVKEQEEPQERTSCKTRGELQSGMAAIIVTAAGQACIKSSIFGFS
jgi:hypothetical protein